MAKQVRNPDRFAHMRGTVRFGRCDLCGFEYPETQITMQEGLAVCVDDYEKNGLEQGRQRQRNEGTSLAAQISASHKVPRFGGSDFITKGDVGVILPLVRLVVLDGANQYEAVPDPLATTGTAALAVNAYGERLTSTNVTAITFSHAGMTASGITHTSDEQLDFTIDTVAVPAGIYDMTFTYGPFGTWNTFKGKVLVR